MDADSETRRRSGTHQGRGRRRRAQRPPADGVDRRSARSQRAKTSEKAIVLACELPDEPVVVEGDANRLQQVVWNLLTNAIKFSGENAPVQVSLTTDEGTAVLRVRDRGAGIAPEFLPHVFDMFRQQERGARRSYGGLGIGLAIAKRVTELHRGTIEVHSEGMGRGAEFCVRLPLASSPPAEAAESAMVFRSLPIGAVLLVEDVPDTREAAHALLEEMGVRVIEAAEGVEALAMLDRHPVDLVLCDLRMPLMDGFELIRHIREHPRHRELPVIAVSGYATEDDEQRTRAAGFDGYVRKPFVESTLAAAVDRVLHERGVERRSSTG
ncbi:MAG: response regulator [Deltaproteobacteria bacterium]|nr:MAG: response regulator [Deltaproteobacteria bacterium]